MMLDLPIHAQLAAEIDADIAARTKEHQVAITNLRAAATHAANFAERPQLKRPLVLLAHGDSWFDYPLNGNSVLPLGHTDIIAQLKSMGPLPPVILNIAHAGDATTSAMSLPKQQRMINALADPANWLESKKPDGILFSGGGDDIAGNQFCIFLNFSAPGVPGLNAERFSGVLASVRASYLDLFAFRDRYAPGVPIFGHAYDFPIPNGKHPICVGPWLLPSLRFSNWTVDEGADIIKDALEQFNAVLQALAADVANNFTLVETQNTLSASDWANELHPYPDGFKALAQKFATELSHKFS